MCFTGVCISLLRVLEQAYGISGGPWMDEYYEACCRKPNLQEDEEFLGVVARSRGMEDEAKLEFC